jgi:hypothetical protein
MKRGGADPVFGSVALDMEIRVAPSARVSAMCFANERAPSYSHPTAADRMIMIKYKEHSFAGFIRD